MSAIRLGVTENILSDPSRVTRQMYVDYLETLGRGWVAEVDGVVVGFSYANNTDGSIWALFLSKQFEGRGIARHLLDLAVAWLFAQGHDAVQLSTGTQTRADRFYHAQGWTRERVDGKDAHYVLNKSKRTLPAAL
ncbi:MAG TPA: GNAT family N-acetyltransferase [Telluria sp.]